MTFRRILPLGGLVAAAVALAPAAPAMAVQNIGGCQLDGLAKLTPGLTANQGTPLDWGPAFDYTFHGDLTGCADTFADNFPGGSSTGKIVAGETITLDGVAYEWPASIAKPTGNGGCTGSHTDGTALVLWDTGTASVIDYSTDGVAAGIALTGTFGSATIPLVSVAKNPDGTPVATRTLVADDYAGDYTGGPLAFHPADPTQCTGAGGVTESPITGVIGHGNYQ
jgi:hypothetical protein